MNLLDYWKYMFKWNAKATRQQYLLPTLVYNIIYSILFVQTGEVTRDFGRVSVNNNNFIVVIIGFAIFIAQFTLTARRLHDSNRPTGWLALNFLPFIGQIWLFILCLMPNKTKKQVRVEDMPNQEEK